MREPQGEAQHPMNYPVWDVPFGPQWLIAAIAVVHVFVSHFAIGGGLMLVLLERKAWRQDDPALREYLQRHTRFFVYLTLVGGALTGVGIWFTIGLVSPEATSNLIHTFVWVWAIEWVFFLVEVLSILVYNATWNSMPRTTHWVVGWVYFGAAYLSLMAIDGILSFQLTPGAWLKTHTLLSGFFNPGFAPSLLARTFLCGMLGGLYALLTVSWSKDRLLKEEVGRYAGGWVWVSALLAVPAAWWMWTTVPKESQALLHSNYLLGRAAVIVTTAGSLLAILAFALAWLWPRGLTRALALLFMLLGFLTVGGFEWSREDLRKPYLIYGYVYVNQVPVRSLESLREKGLLASSLYVSQKSITPQNEKKAGEELFRIACAACHRPAAGTNALAPRLKGLDSAFVGALIERAGFMKGGMPPFPGKPGEARAIARYLVSLAPVVPVSNDGAAVFARRCAQCHTVAGPFRPVGKALEGQSAADIADLIAGIDSMSDKMPAWTGNDIERQSLAQYLSKAAAERRTP
jgi:mono/diheme cytochrome c family protein/cytochrome bd-type quinol oxidase subunit 1